ncbi:beta-ketoacyl-ACP synthase I [Sorangium cellulosum]|uniref:Beta-ketoacyl-ACP synthase I n=1 Tax=Sorangium cellulosum TaxID=56 RepID=A0A2L0EYT7_SORCE|nr:3-oxoacyl-[acyl-carrier-protein] synthase III C-terminal domain-containing protein [Sorangium cellulosum]AUX44462.1 beta-ketoacyl-ACP synthase I [Sorangium cellulosum]
MFGIIDIGLGIPTTRMSARAISAASGVPIEFFSDRMQLASKPVAEGRRCVELSLDAIEDLKARCPFAPDSLDLLVYASTGLNDHAFWSPAAKIQASLGAKGAFCFELSNGCNSLNAALHVIKGLMLASPSYRRALLVCADTLSRYVDHTDPGSKSLFNLADGASAILCDRYAPSLHVLSSAFASDGTYVDLYKLPRGAPTIVTEPREAEVSLHEQYLHYITRLVGQVLDEARLTPRDIDYLFMNQGDHRVLREVLSRFGLGEAQSYLSFRDHGHLGATDTALALAEGLRTNRLRPGQRIVLVSSGVGFSWGASLIQI